MDGTLWKTAAVVVALIASVFTARWLAWRASGSSVVRQVLTMVLSTAIFLLLFSLVHS